MPCVGLDLCSYLYYKCFPGSQHLDHAALLSLVPIYIVSGHPQLEKMDPIRKREQREQMSGDSGLSFLFGMYRI